MRDDPEDHASTAPIASPSEATRDSARQPAFWPPRGSLQIGDYSLRDLAAKILMQLDDVADIERYRSANAVERAAQDPRPPIVLMGDSITDFWPVDKLAAVSGLRFVNRGISGQNSSVMLLRFQADVIDLAPAAVVILAGTNDLRAYVGDPDDLTPATLERLSRNLTAMANMAKGCGIAVLVSTLPPVGADLASIARSPAAVDAVNRWIASFALARNYPLVDYFAVLASAQGLMPDQFSDDGVHPNALGYARMQPVLLDALARLNFPDTNP